MKKIIWVLLALIAGLTATANPLSSINLKGSFRGKITDGKTGQPVAGVTVFITDIRSGSSSDANGNFYINNVPEGRHLVELSHIGYTSIAEYIVVNGETQKDFILIQSIVEGNAVIVTGVTTATQLKKVPFSVEVMRKQDLQQSASANIIESLTKLGGVSTLSTGPAISKPVIRGLGYNRVLTINDGVRQEGQQWGDEHGIEVDEASVNKIELLKGPASIIYGSDAMAGVINIISNVPVPVNTIKANFSGNYQTNNLLRAGNANIAGNYRGFNWNVYSSNRAAADYQNKYDGRVFNSKFKENNAGGYIGYNGNWGFSHLLVSSFNLKTGLVEGERDAGGNFIKPVAGGGEETVTTADLKSIDAQIPYQHIRHFKVASDNSFKLGKNRLSLNLGFQRNRREEFGNADDLDERALYFDLKTFTYTSQFHFAEMKGWKTSIGINGMQQNNTNKGVEQLIPDYNLFDFGVYGYAQKTIKKLNLSGGLRYDTRQVNIKDLLDAGTVKGNGFSTDFSNVSGSLGLAAELSKQVNLKFNVARGYRAPSIPELASNGSHEGTSRYEYGDPGLKSETSLQFDAGLDFNTEHISMGFSAFYNRFHNFIFYRRLEAAAGGDSSVVVGGDNLTAFKFDQRKAALAGFEVNMDIHPHPLDWLHFENSFSYVKGTFSEAIDGDKDIPFIPAAKLVNELRANFSKPVKGLANLYVKVELNNTFRQRDVFTTYNTETKTSGYSLLNAGMGTDIVNRKGKTLFSVNIAAINLTDVAYQNHLSRLKYAAENIATGRNGVFNMGRNFSFRLNVPLSFDLK
jgi:iron complex outermembrane recepter protein